jgi:hypothetical protein
VPDIADAAELTIIGGGAPRLIHPTNVAPTGCQVTKLAGMRPCR